MMNRWLARLLCLFVVLGIALSLGCSASRQRQTRYAIRTDLDNMVGEIQWFLGLDEPSILTEDTFPPYR